MTSFIILHYKNLTDTLECISSIKKLKGDKISIIVVDNGTLINNEKEILLKVTPDVICNEENLGFAKGNNIGVSYAIKTYHPEFLVVINNDIVINQKDFLKKIRHTYDKTKFDLLGPKIITNGGESVNPFPAYQTLEEVNEAILKAERLVSMYQNALFSFLLNSYIFLKSKIKKPKHLINGEKEAYNVAIHGCCIVFSKKYYQKYEKVFYDETFLYHEEEFLEYRRNKDHLTSFYEPTIEVFHKEGASLNYSFEHQRRKKLIFRNQEIIKSLKLLKIIMVEHKNI